MKPRKTRKTDHTTAAPVKAAVDGTQEATPQDVADGLKHERGKELQRNLCLSSAQDMAESFNDEAKCIMKARLRFLYRQDDPELVMEYENWHSFMDTFRRLTRKHVENCPALPEVPKLNGNDYYAGMIHLSDFCAEVAERLCPAPRTAAGPRKADTLKPMILKVFDNLPPDKKRDYLKGEVGVFPAMKRLGYDGKTYYPIARALTALVNAKVLESVTGLGFRLKQPT